MASLAKLYSRIFFKNSPSQKTPLNEANLNKMDKAIDDLDNRVVDVNGQLVVERERINNMAKLPEGSTTGDAELIDGRTDYKGTTHTNIGAHIRDVSSQLSGEIVELEANGYINLFNINSYYSKDNVASIDSNTITLNGSAWSGGVKYKFSVMPNTNYMIGFAITSESGIGNIKITNSNDSETIYMENVSSTNKSIEFNSGDNAIVYVYFRIGGAECVNFKYTNISLCLRNNALNSIKRDILEINEKIVGINVNSVGETQFYVNRGEEFTVEVHSNTIQTNLFCGAYEVGDNYYTLLVGSGVYVFTAYKSGYVRLQQNSTVINLTLYRGERKRKTYTVDINGYGDYNSFTEMLTELECNSDEKTVYIKAGTYDILNEIGGADYLNTLVGQSLNWRDVCKVLPPNTKLVGVGEVVLSFEPTDDEMPNAEVAFLFSPLNISGECEIENITIKAKNCRYAIHDESSSDEQYANTVHKYKNVRAYKERGGKGAIQCFGSGLARNSKWYFENCFFESDTKNVWTVHTCTAKAEECAQIVFRDCIIKNTIINESNEVVQFITGSATNGHNANHHRVNMNNCYISGKIGLTDNGDCCEQVYDLSLLGTNVKGIQVADTITSNPYEVEVY